VIAAESVRAARPARPYPGLRPFEPEEWSIFFGREPMIDEVIDRLARTRLVLIHGASGSGKSSLVRAGVLPKLARQYQRHGAPWLTCAMRPSGGPLWNLATEFARLEGHGADIEGIGAIVGRFNAREATLASVADSVGSLKGKSLCVLVDQFEELFRFEKEKSREEAELFVDLIGRAAADEEREPKPDEADVRIVVTMRSEFLGECARFAGLAETINRTQYLVPRMEDDGLMRAVRRPAQMYGGTIDEGLAERLIASVRGREDELPLLQHGLMLMWDEAVACAASGGRPALDGAMVDKAGSLAGLLSNHADAVMESVAPDDGRKKIVEKVFCELTDVNSEGSAVRRPRRFSDLCAVSGASTDELRPILDAFRAPGVSFLTPYAPTPISDSTRIDISHEALIRCWRRIAGREGGWLKQEFDDGLAWRSLLSEARAFERDKTRVLSASATKDRTALYAGHNEAWSRRYGGGWEPVGTLLDASRDAVAAARRWRRVRSASLTGVAVGALAFAFAAWWEKRQADIETAQVEAESTKERQAADVLTIIFERVRNLGRTGTADGPLEQQLFAGVLFFAEKNNAYAENMAGVLYAQGFGTFQDFVKARQWFEKAALHGVPRAIGNLGVIYQYGTGVARDYTKARELFEEAAAAGDSRSMANLGVFYETGDGVAQEQYRLEKGVAAGEAHDYSKAREWYEKGAAAGNEVSMGDLGFLYESGHGVAKDYGKAREWYEKGAAGGDARSMGNLGALYANGQGVAQDYGKAREWYEKGAAAGNAMSMGNLGWLYDNGKGVAQDYAKAREWYEKAAAVGNDWSMNNLGLLYDNGRGVAQDYAKAREWFEKGVAAGNGHSAQQLGAMYTIGVGVAQDYAKAREWFERAAAAGDGQSMRILAEFYATGSGGTLDYSKAAEWLEKDAATGDVVAMRDLGNDYLSGNIVPPTYSKAREWFERAAAAGDGQSMLRLAVIYENGYGASQDYARALDWNSKAAVAIEAEESKSAGAPGAQTAVALADVTWSALFVKDFDGALAAAERGHRLDPHNLIVEGNHAHALMFLNRTDEARALYLSHRDEPIAEGDKRTWRQAVLDGFAQFRKAGLTHPLMAEIEAAFARGKK